MSAKPSLFAELKRRNVLRAGVLYIGAVWAISQGLAQLLPLFGDYGWIARGFLIACAVGFPFWIVFAWFYEWTPQGLKRESEIEADASITRGTGRKLDKWIIAVLTLAVVLLLTNTFVWHKGAGLTNGAAFANIPAKSVAVLPLVNESGDKGQQYFSDGLSEDLITALSQFSGLKVINRDSSFRFRNSKDSVQDIGEKLGVTHLLEGSVQKLGDEVRINAELVNVSDGSTLWSQHYDRPYKDLFALQDDITKAVTVALEAKLLNANNGAVLQSDRPPSGNLAAYNDVLQGRFYDRRGTEADVRKAIDYFTTATRLDPNYALAWAYLGEANTGLAGNYLGGNEAAQTWDKARAEVQTALSLNPNLWVAHSADKFILISIDHDWARAEIEAERAYQLNPDDFFDLATVRGALGQTRQAVELIQRGLPSDPLCLSCYDYLARLLPGLGRFDEAEQAARKALQLQPESGFSRMHLVYIEAMRGDVAAALQSAQQQPSGNWRDLMLAFALQVGSDRVAADKALQTVIAKQADYHAYYIAEMYALRHDPDSMFKWLERARASRDYSVQLLLTDPAILRYKDDPRFAAFCKEVGLPTTTDAKALP